MAGNSKTFEARFLPRPQSLLSGKREDPGVQGEILFPDLTWLQILKWPPKRTHEVSYLYSVFKILSDSELPVLFSFLRDLQNWGRLESTDKKSPSWRRVWAVWLRPGNSLVLQKNTGPSGSKCQFALNPGLNLTAVSFSCIQKNFLG